MRRQQCQDKRKADYASHFMPDLQELSHLPHSIRGNLANSVILQACGSH